MIPVVEVRNAAKRFGGTAALNGVSFDVMEGQCLSLLGPSGCGKTTTLRIIAGFEQVDSGAVRINGEDMSRKRPYERNIGLVFQDYALFPHMTVEQNIAYGMRHRKMSKAEVPARLKEILAVVKLTGFERRRPSQLSGGEQQRVALARALATQPELLLLDEPMSNLDAKLREQVREEIKQILKETGSTTIIVTHDQQEAMSMAETVIVMNAGRVMQQGNPQEIYSRPANRFVADFIGRATWLVGILQEEVSPGIRRFQSNGGLSLLVSAGTGSEGQECQIGIRPERVTLVSNSEGTPCASVPCRNLLPGRVKAVTHLGPDVQLTLATNHGVEILALEKYVGQSIDLEGEALAACFDPGSCIVLPVSIGKER